MCGLILVLGDRRTEVLNALGAMSYRGLEGKQGVSVRGGWTLGHVRLAIQDLSDASAQPTEIGNGAFAFVGELFGHAQASDLRVAEEAYITSGFRAFHDFDGFWAMAAIYDSGYAEVATDFLGIKPLYYWEKEAIICSEIEPMFAIEPPPELDEIYLSNCIKFGYDYSGRTPYKGITQIPPGTSLHFDDSHPTSTTYWDWERVKTYPITEDGIFDELILSCRNRLTSDREVGLLVSGGLDSSLVYYILKAMGQLPKCFSVENGESEFLPPGVTPLPEAPVSILDAMSAMQAPVDLGSMLPQYMLGEALKREGLRVCLSGDGADELFGGYSRSQEYDSQMSDVFCELPYYHLPRLDRMMMRHTVELRTPYLSPSLVKMAMKLPRGLRTGKQVLKRIARGLVPQEIIDRPKVPLKSFVVREGGLQYRKALVDLFRQHYSTLKAY